MNFSNDSQYIINELFEKKIITKTNKKIDSLLSKNIKSIVKVLYDDLCSSYSYTKSSLNQENYLKEFFNKITSKKDIPGPLYEKSHFFPKSIKKEIIETMNFCYTFSFKLFHRSVNINIVTEDKIKSDDYIFNIISWLYIASIYSNNNCAKILNIFIYLSDSKKYIPNHKNNHEYITKPLGVNNVNTAYTDCCNNKSDIVIYRKEEWFKVFIHETMHTLGLDFCKTYSDEFKKKIHNLFPINSDLLIYESYCETWATIINSSFNSFNQINKQKINKKCSSQFADYFNYFTIFLNIEIKFSLFQMIKTLDYMGLEYKDLYLKNKQSSIKRKYLYHENSNIFCYYILKTIFLYHYDSFLIWCNKYNTSLINFYHTPNNELSFFKLIKSLYKNDDFINDINNINKIYNDNCLDNNYLRNNYRMSCIENK